MPVLPRGNQLEGTSGSIRELGSISAVTTKERCFSSKAFRSRRKQNCNCKSEIYWLGNRIIECEIPSLTFYSPCLKRVILQTFLLVEEILWPNSEISVLLINNSITGYTFISLRTTSQKKTVFFLLRT